ncbi:MAG: hypothetical protein AABY22_10400 [Nanoarchaeota archaeon]
MVNKIKCDGCGLLSRSISIRIFKDKFLCFKCWRKSQFNIIGFKSNKFIEPLTEIKTAHFTLTKSQNKMFIKQLKKLNIRNSEYIRMLILNDFDKNDNN